MEPAFTLGILYGCGCGFRTAQYFEQLAAYYLKSMSRREEQCLSEWQIAEEIKRRKNRELYLQELTEVLYESALNKVTKDFYEKSFATNDHEEKKTS